MDGARGSFLVPGGHGFVLPSCCLVFLVGDGSQGTPMGMSLGAANPMSTLGGPLGAGGGGGPMGPASMGAPMGSGGPMCPGGGANGDNSVVGGGMQPKTPTSSMEVPPSSDPHGFGIHSVPSGLIIDSFISI